MQNAMYCKNGHYVGEVNPVLRARSWGKFQAMAARAESEGKEQLPQFCSACGAQTVSACQHCQSPIKVSRVKIRPGYCGECGKPFTWTETALSAAKSCIDELDVSPEEKTKQKGNLENLTKNTEQTQFAASSFKKFMNKIGPTAGLLREIIVPILTTEVKKLLGI